MKQWFYLDRYDILVMIVCYPAVFLANYLILGQPYFDEWRIFVPVTLGLTVLYVFFAWIMDSWMKYMRYRFTELNQVVRRLTYCLIGYILVTALLVCLIFWVYGKLNVPGYQFDRTVFGWVLLIGLCTNIISAGISEAAYSYEKWRASVAREYELKELHMQQQLDVLKQQVNPHFLFNSLNSLIALIEEDPRQAGTFAEELSSVYRYVLRANDHNLTDLQTELDFIQSYYHLLKTRYGRGLDLVVAIDEQCGHHKLPPLTLQLLVENAVKHNEVGADRPLRIEICTDQQAQLSVRNTLQKKPARVLSNGVGLSNIMAKYRMLGQPAPVVQETNGLFVVTLPLIRGT
ncbi:hypothetical protein GCM10023187_54060 [Nibrella viscosa]|uniref:Signal transduction histidine kinase internal region domain-containing protein n=1 Tax=Nibrella viscosa TaxID=1084524 RepID=A0ABP8L100_9BACT